MLSLILMIELAVFAQSYLGLNNKAYLASVLPSVLETLTNNQRLANNANVLTENRLLIAAANLKASDMAQRGYFAHNTPEGYLPWYWLDVVGYKYAHAGENLAVNYTDSVDVVNAWMNSPTHRANIVKPVYTETGIGLSQGIYDGRPAIFVTQFFGTPAITAAATTPTKAVASLPATKNSKPAVKVTAVQNSSSTLATTSVTAKVERIATSSVPKNIVSTILGSKFGVNSEKVAGAETAEFPVKKVSLIEKLLSSPRHTGSYALFVILGIFISAFLLILIVNKKIHHKRIIFTAVVVTIIIVGVMIFNENFFKPRVIIDGGRSIFIEDSKI